MQLPTLLLLTILTTLATATQNPRTLPGVVWKPNNASTLQNPSNLSPQGTSTALISSAGQWGGNSSNGTSQPTSRPVVNAANVAKFFPSGGVVGLGAFVAGGIAFVL